MSKNFAYNACLKNKMRRLCKDIDYTYCCSMGDKKASKTINLKGGIVTDDNGQGDLMSLTVGYSFEYDPSSTWSQKVRKLEQMFRDAKSRMSFNEEASLKIAYKTDYCRIWMKNRLCCDCGWQIVSLYLAYKMSKNDAKSNLGNNFLCRRKIDIIHMLRNLSVSPTMVNQSKGVEINPKEIMALLHGKKITAFTGAGISAKSGIPCFDREFKCSLSLNEADFPDKLLDQLLSTPWAILNDILDFQWRLATSRPNEGHSALTQLQEMGILDSIITSNLDMLHQEAGSKNIIEMGRTKHYKKYFRDTDIGQQALRKSDVLLVLGVSSDEYGIINYARDKGLIIVVVCKDRPDFLHSHDFYIQAKCEEFLPQLANKLYQF